MEALLYFGAYDIWFSEMPDTEIELPTDVLVKLTTTNSCCFRPAIV